MDTTLSLSTVTTDLEVLDTTETFESTMTSMMSNASLLDLGQGGGHRSSLGPSIAFAISTVLIVSSNALTLTVLRRKPDCFEEIPRQIFVALALTDLLTGMSCCLFSSLFAAAPHLQNTATCTVRTMACTGCLNQSALTMAFATVDRLIAITRPLRYPSVLTVRRARVVIGTFAAISISNAAFTNVGADYDSIRKHGSCVSDFSAVGIGISFRPSLVVILLIFYGSLSVATVSNVIVVRVALKHARSIADRGPGAQPSIPPPTVSGSFQGQASATAGGRVNPPPPPINQIPQQKQGSIKRKTMRSLWAVLGATVAFYIAVIPWNIMASLHFAKHVQIPNPLRIAAAFLLINNSWWNTVIYALLNTTFRRAAKKALSCAPCCRGQDDVGEFSHTGGGDTGTANISLDA